MRSELSRRSPDANEPSGMASAPARGFCVRRGRRVTRTARYDNDGVDDNSGETQLLNVGDIL